MHPEGVPFGVVNSHILGLVRPPAVVVGHCCEEKQEDGSDHMKRSRGEYVGHDDDLNPSSHRRFGGSGRVTSGSDDVLERWRL
jgi:hypothetical protein